MSTFFDMGGYGAFVWSAYGITLLVLILNIWWARRRNAAALARVQAAISTDEETAVPRAMVRRL
jgi:heme exporter protein CcmD